MEFKGTKYKLNQLIEVIYENEDGYIAISLGRLYDYDVYKYIAIDYSSDFWELERTIKIPIDKVKNIRKVNYNPMWR